DKRAGHGINGAVLSRKRNEMGLKGRHSQVESASELVDVALGLRGDALALGAVIDPGADPHRQLTGVADEFRRADAVKLFVNFAEIGYMRAVHYRGAKLDRLDRILAAMGNQRATHKHDRSELID